MKEIKEGIIENDKEYKIPIAEVKNNEVSLQNIDVDNLQLKEIICKDIVESTEKSEKKQINNTFEKDSKIFDQSKDPDTSFGI